jgi:hypothetical protein
MRFLALHLDSTFIVWLLAASTGACEDGSDGLSLATTHRSPVAGDTSDSTSPGSSSPTTDSRDATTGAGDRPANPPNDPPNNTPTDVPDAAVRDSDSGEVADASIACTNTVASPGSGHHYPGLDCATCHAGLGFLGLDWTVSGTLFTAPGGGAPVAGATIVVVDRNQQTLELTTYSNGNFYTKAPVAFPVTVQASACPSTVRMTASASPGSCNKNGCHSSQMQIHLP